VRSATSTNEGEVDDAQARLCVAVVAPGPFPAPRGSQVLIRQLAEALAQRGHEIHIIAYDMVDTRSPVSPAVRIHRAGRTLLWLRRFLPWAVWKGCMDLAVAKRLRRLLRDYPIQLIHAHNYDGPLIAWIARWPLSVPVVYHAHNLLADELPAYFRSPVPRRLLEKIGAWLDRTIPRRAEAVVALSPGQAAHLRAVGVDEARLLVCPPPSEPLAIQKPERSIRQKERWIVGYAGNLDGYQDLDVLAAAADSARREGAKVTLLLVTHEEKWKRRLPERLTALVRHGAARLVWAAGGRESCATLARADILVCPRGSWSGFPIKLINYALLGKPTILARSVARAVGWPAEVGVFPDGDVQALARVLRQACESEAVRERMAQAARDFAARLPAPAAAGALMERWFADTVRHRGRSCAKVSSAAELESEVLGVDTHWMSSYKPTDASREGETRA